MMVDIIPHLALLHLGIPFVSVSIIHYPISVDLIESTFSLADRPM
jgi:hypothetical protein